VSPRSPRSARLTRALLGVARLPRDEWALLALALVLLPPVSVGLRLVGLRRALALVEALSPAHRRCAEDDPRGAPRTAWLVEVAARCWRPRPTCLAKALVVLSLLKRRGLPVQLVVGVTKARGPLEGHAWVELGGAVVGADPGPASDAVLVRIPAWLPTSATIAPRERAP
jgi:hypothetical protein